MLLAGIGSTPPEQFAEFADFAEFAEFAEFADRVRAAGVEVESRTYPDAPHSFFDGSSGEHGQARADAWRRILDLLAAHS